MIQSTHNGYKFSSHASEKMHIKLTIQMVSVCMIHGGDPLNPMMYYNVFGNVYHFYNDRNH